MGEGPCTKQPDEKVDEGAADVGLNHNASDVDVGAFLIQPRRDRYACLRVGYSAVRVRWGWG